jgi:hypothetical protein
MIKELKNKALNMWQSRRYRQVWQDHKVCVIAIAVLVVALIIK